MRARRTKESLGVLGLVIALSMVPAAVPALTTPHCVSHTNDVHLVLSTAIVVPIALLVVLLQYGRVRHLLSGDE